MNGAGTLDFISFVPWTFIVMIANAYILYRLVRHFLFKPVKEIFRKRQQELDDIYTGANELQAQANQAKEEYDEKLKTASSKANSIIETADKNAQIIQQEKTLQAKQEAKQIVESAKIEAEQIKQTVTQNLKQDVADLSIEIAKKVTEKEISGQDHLRLIEDSIRQLQEDAG